MPKPYRHSYPPTVQTKQGPASLIGKSADGLFVLLSYAVPKELRSKTIGPCRNLYLPISEVLEDV